MPIFRYDAYRNPYGPSIAEALQEQGRITSAEALRVGNLQADAAQQRGAIQAHMWGTVGNAIGAIPQEMRANREMALREEQQRRRGELDALQLDAARRDRAAEQRVGALYDSMRDEQGHVDLDKFQAMVPGEDLRYAGPVIAQIEQSQGRRQTQITQKRKAASDVAGGMVSTGDLSPEAVTSFLDLGRRAGAFTEGEHAHWAGLLAADPTKGPEQVLRQVVGAAAQEPVFRDPTHTGYDKLTGKPIVPGTPKPLDLKPANDVEGPNGELLSFNPATGWWQTGDGTIVKNPGVRKPVETPATVETRRHNQALEAIGQLTAGRAEAAHQETARHNAAMEAAAAGKKTNRPVLSSDANRLTDINTGVKEADTLATEISGKTGTGSWIGANLPNVVTNVTGLGTESKQRQAVIDRVKQLIGKTLEGGVLRKEDEIKYEKILPVIGDPPAVAAAKLAGLREMLVRKRETTLESLSDAGFNVDAYTTRGAPGAAPAAPAGSVRILSITPVP